MSLPSYISIGNTDIHLWIAVDDQCSSKELLEKYHSLLNQRERERHQRFHFERDRNQYLVTRAVLRSVLSLYSPDISPEKWYFLENGYGKPYLPSSLTALPLSFNLSHTYNLVALAVTVENDIGVDVEDTLRDNNAIDIAESYFSSVETDDLFELDKALQQNRFFELWTLKEAYIKACGMGLSIPLNSFSYSFPAKEKIAISFSPERNDSPDNWQFRQFNLFNTYKIAIAIKTLSEMKNDLTLSIKSIVPLDTISTHPLPGNLEQFKTSR